jgi:hypothetical protein
MSFRCRAAISLAFGAKRTSSDAHRAGFVSYTKDHASKRSSSSLPGLTRQSIILRILRFFKMDARVKPAHDESIIARTSISAPLARGAGELRIAPRRRYGGQGASFRGWPPDRCVHGSLVAEAATSRLSTMPARIRNRPVRGQLLPSHSRSNTGAPIAVARAQRSRNRV